MFSVTWKAFRLFYRANPKLTGSALVLNSLVSLSPLVFAYLTSLLVDQIIDTISHGKSLNSAYWLIGGIVLLAIVSAVLNNLRSIVNQKFTLFTDYFLDKEMMEKVSKMDLADFENPQTSNRISKISRNASRVYRLVDVAVFIVPELMVITVALVALIALSPLMILLILLTTLPLFFEELFYGKRVWGIWDANIEVVRDYNDTSYYVRSDKSIGEIKLFGLTDYLTKRAVSIYETFINQQMQAAAKRMKTGIALSFLSAGGIGASFLLIGSMAIAGKITIGSITFYIQTARTLAETLGNALTSLANLIDHSAYAEEFFEVMDQKNKIVSGDKILPQSLNPPVIEFDNITFKYPNTTHNIFDGFSLKIEPGQNIAIVGKNGAGKTTLIKLLMRLYDVDSGEIRINKVPINELDLEDLYKHLSTLFQTFNTYHYSAKANIGFGKIENIDDMDAIVKAAKMSGAHDFIDNYEHKYEQVLSKRYEGGIEPSYGQWQKIALARAFFRNPDILVLDEPTSAIDPKSEFEIFERLFEFAQNKTVIIISHRFSTVRNASRIIVLDDGKIVEDGSHEDLMSIENGVYKTAFEIQRKGYE